MHCVSYGRHRVSRQRLVSYGHRLVFATCTVRTTFRRGIVWTPSSFAKCTLHTTPRRTVHSLSYGRNMVLRRAQYARRDDVCLMNGHNGSYGCHRVSRQNLVSYGRHLFFRQSLVSFERHLVSRRAQYERRKVVCRTNVHSVSYVRQ